MERTCGICAESLELNEVNFHKDKSRPLGFMYNCKSCEKKRGQEKYQKNPRLGRYASYTVDQKKKKYEIARKYAVTHIGRAIALTAAYRNFDKARGYENNITKHDIDNVRKNTACTYCGFPSTGFDRIDNSKGHMISNCVPCCSECNTMRMDLFTVEEMKIIGQTIRTVKLLRAV